VDESSIPFPCISEKSQKYQNIAKSSFKNHKNMSLAFKSNIFKITKKKKFPCFRIKYLQNHQKIFPLFSITDLYPDHSGKDSDPHICKNHKNYQYPQHYTSGVLNSAHFTASWDDGSNRPQIGILTKTGNQTPSRSLVCPEEHLEVR